MNGIDKRIQSNGLVSTEILVEMRTAIRYKSGAVEMRPNCSAVGVMYVSDCRQAMGRKMVNKLLAGGK